MIRLIPSIFCFVVLSGSLAGGGTLSADLLIDFEDGPTGAMFHGDGVGDTAGPFLIDGLLTVLTTSAVTGTVAVSSFGLGVNSGGGDPDPNSFNVGESWGFRADRPFAFMGLELGGLSPGESIDIQSAAWINLAGITPGLGVTYAASTGTFTLVDGPAGDVFTLAELTGGQLLIVGSNVNLVFGNFTSSVSPNDDLELQWMTLHAIPEPSGLALLMPILVGIGMRRRRNNCKRN